MRDNFVARLRINCFIKMSIPELVTTIAMAAGFTITAAV